MSDAPDAQLWQARHFVYTFWVEQARPPTARETAEAIGLAFESAVALYTELDKRHALMLMPGTSMIRMANPFSSVPTGFRVRVGEKRYYANCAWDAFGIAAALHADATIDAFCAGTQDLLRLQVTNGRISGDAAIAHFRIPFAHWYDDLVYT